MNDIGMRDEIYEIWSSFDNPYERLYVIATYLVKQNPEATFYDLFNTIREDVFQGHPLDETSLATQQLDMTIEYEESRRDYQ